MDKVGVSFDMHTSCIPDQVTSSSSHGDNEKLPFTIPYPTLTTPPTANPDITTTPHYIITHQGGVDLQDYTNNRLV